MNKRLSEALKVDMGIAPVSRAHNGRVISRLIPLGPGQRKVMFPITVISADLNNAQVIDIGIVDDVVGAGAVAATGNLATVAAAGNALVYRRLGAGIAALGVSSMSVDLTASADGAVTINGTVFPYAAVPAAGTNEWNNAAALVLAVNASGLGLTASAAGEVVTLISAVAGNREIRFTTTVAAVATTDILILQFTAVMEVDASQMDLENGATGVFAVVDFINGAGTIVVAAPAIRGASRYTPQHAISAFA